METSQEFRDLLRSFLEDNPNGEGELANEFEVAPSTVQRWASGTSRPHPGVRQLIINYLKNRSHAG